MPFSYLQICEGFFVMNELLMLPQNAVATTSVISHLRVVFSSTIDRLFSTATVRQKRARTWEVGGR
jgi:hypothetical protein